MDERKSRMNSVKFFFFNDTATTEIYTLSLHDALPISRRATLGSCERRTSSTQRRASASPPTLRGGSGRLSRGPDRKSTRLNSSHANISYAVFCLKKKNIMSPLMPSLVSLIFSLSLLYL